MKKTGIARFFSSARDDQGQALVMVCFSMIILLGFAGLVIDFGRAYIAYRQLQMSTDAAALAGALELPKSDVVATATTYSGTGTNLNALANLPNVTFVTGYPLVRCLTALTNAGQGCVAPANGNALQVKEQVTIPLYFGALFGTSSITMTASATGAVGGVSIPYNVAIVLDTTASMSSTDSSCGGISRLACAMQGVRYFMQNMSPCASSTSTCTVTNGVAANSVDKVALFTFPNVTVTMSNNGQLCNGYSGTLPNYSFPSTTATTYAPSGGSTATYELTPYWSDYKTGNNAASLNTTSYLVQSVAGKSGCSGLSNPGGDGTYYAGAIYAAQDSLVAAAAANPGSQNVIILLSDGDASSTKFDTSATGYSTTTGTYPSSKNQCAQAVTAAQAASAAGTKVFAVAYGASNTSGCSTDSGSYKNNPCYTMSQIASSAKFFFSADYSSSNVCQSTAQPTSNMAQIFTNISNNLKTSRIIPDNVT